MAIKHKLGWKRPLPQKHKNMYFPKRGAVALPTSVDLRPLCPAVYDQGNLGSCTANAGAALAQFVMKKTGHPWYVPSRLAIYYWERVLENDVGDDSGATLTDCINVLTKQGAPHESLWWYNIAKFTIKPNKAVAADGLNHLMTKGLAITQDLTHIKTCLAEGYPVIFGFTVYSSFENIGSNGIMPMPKSSESVLGGHAVMAVGYDDAKQYVTVRNSWGAGWGASGYFYMPYAFISDKDYADDFWTSEGFQTFTCCKCKK